MATTLSYGYVRPSDGDRGITFWDQLADDITQLNSHSHNGTDSARLTSQSITAVSAAITTAGWSLQSNGIYRQTVNMPAGTDFDDYGIAFQITASTGSVGVGQRVDLLVEKVSDTSYYLYSNDNALAVTAIYIV